MLRDAPIRALLFVVNLHRLDVTLLRNGVFASQGSIFRHSYSSHFSGTDFNFQIFVTHPLIWYLCMSGQVGIEPAILVEYKNSEFEVFMRDLIVCSLFNCGVHQIRAVFINFIESADYVLTDILSSFDLI